MNLKQRLRKKLKKNGGFTLIEMLIVVAIIAILVVVSIPMVNSNLNEARKATDAANERAAKAAAMITFMTENPGKETTYSYQEDGTIVEGTPKDSKGFTYSQSTDNQYVQVVINADGTIKSIGWVNAPTTPATSE